MRRATTLKLHISGTDCIHQPLASVCHQCNKIVLRNREGILAMQINCGRDADVESTAAL